MRTLALAAALALGGCKGSENKAVVVPDAPAGSSHVRSDEEMFNQFMDGMERQLEADLRAGVRRSFASEDEARQFLWSLTPAGFRARPEYFGESIDGGAPQALATRMSDWARAHPDAVEQRIKAFALRMEPLFKELHRNIRTQFPPSSESTLPPGAKRLAWLSTGAKGIEAAKRAKKPIVIDFSASWCNACKEFDDRTYSDSRVLAAADRFVTVRVDATDDDAPELQELQSKYKVLGLPTVVLLDSSGKEAGRFTEFVPPERFLDALQKVK